MSSAREAAEMVEALENAINALEDCKEFEDENILSSHRVLFWEPLGDGGSAILGLKLILDRLRARGN